MGTARVVAPFTRTIPSASSRCPVIMGPTVSEPIPPNAPAVGDNYSLTTVSAFGAPLENEQWELVPRVGVSQKEECECGLLPFLCVS
jgi:hypothetical protein